VKVRLPHDALQSRARAKIRIARIVHPVPGAEQQPRRRLDVHLPPSAGGVHGRSVHSEALADCTAPESLRRLALEGLAAKLEPPRDRQLYVDGVCGTREQRVAFRREPSPVHAHADVALGFVRAPAEMHAALQERPAA
jgi:hypothetical protein